MLQHQCHNHTILRSFLLVCSSLSFSIFWIMSSFCISFSWISDITSDIACRFSFKATFFRSRSTRQTLCQYTSCVSTTKSRDKVKMRKQHYKPPFSHVHLNSAVWPTFKVHANTVCLIYWNSPFLNVCIVSNNMSSSLHFFKHVSATENIYYQPYQTTLIK